MTEIVIGSGPAGVAAATALLDRGRRVLMIDGGKAFAPADAGLKDALAATGPQGWSERQRAAWAAPQFAGPPGQTRRYGSDAGMEPAAATWADAAGVALRASMAEGGLSNLWGAAVLPYAAKDMAGWPVTADDLAPHYRAVAGFLPVQGTDALDGLFPAFPMAGRSALAPSAQAGEVLRRLARLDVPGVTVGAARVAVGDGCRACGMCLHGCPWDLIWSARQALAVLSRHGGFTYRAGPAVVAVESSDRDVTLRLADGTSVTGERAYLGAGVLPTAQILMASGYADRLELKDSQQVLMPFLHRWAAAAAPDRLPFTTLPQVFVEIDRAEVSPFLVHAQLYTWNDHFPRDLIASYGRLPGAAPVLRALARRLIVAQLFLHSAHSGRIGLQLAADGRLVAEPVANPAMPARLDAALGVLRRTLAGAGMTALPFARRVGVPGSSFHVGGSLPMADAPSRGQSDRLGRPGGTGRLHVIDASVFPSVPATTITFSVMANAHRIASEAPDD